MQNQERRIQIDAPFRFNEFFRPLLLCISLLYLINNSPKGALVFAAEGDAHAVHAIPKIALIFSFGGNTPEKRKN